MINDISGLRLVKNPPKLLKDTPDEQNFLITYKDIFKKKYYAQPVNSFDGLPIYDQFKLIELDYLFKILDKANKLIKVEEEFFKLV